MKALNLVTLILVIIGGINWGLVGLLDLNLVTMLLGAWPMVVKIVYILVGASAVYQLIPLCKCMSGGEACCSK